MNTVVALLLSVVCGLAVALLVYLKRQAHWKKRWWPLFLLRASAASLLMWLLVAPPRITQIQEKEPQVFALIVDNSLSVWKGEPGWHEKFIQEWAPAYRQALPEDVEIRFFMVDQTEWHIGDTLGSIAKADNSAIDQSLEQIASGFRPGKIAGIGLISDGIYNPVHIPQNLKSKIRLAHFVGDSTIYPDWKLVDVRVNEKNYTKEANEVLVFVQGVQVKKKAKLRLHLNDTLVGEQWVLPQNKEVQRLPFTLESKRVGRKSLKISLIVDEPDFNEQNNRIQRVLEFYDKFERVLVVGNGLSPDIGGLRRAWGRNSALEWVYSKENNFAKLEGVSVLVLAGKVSNRDAWVTAARKQGVSMMHVCPDIHALRELGVFQSLPETKVEETATPHFETGFTLFGWELGSESKLTGYVPAGSWDIPEGWQPVIYKAVGPVKTNSPLNMVRVHRQVKEAVLIGKGFWRWIGPLEAPHQFARVLESEFRWLCTRTRNENMELRYPSEINLGENAPLEVLVRNDALQPVPDLDVQLKAAQFQLQLVESNGVYGSVLNNLDSGTFHFEVSTDFGGKTLRKKGSILVKNTHPELNDLVGKPDALRRFSSTNQLHNLKDDLQLLSELEVPPYYKTVERSQRPVEQWFWMLLIVILAASEWMLRKWG